MDKERFKPVTEIKTINDIISKFEGFSDGWQTRWDYSQIENMLQEYGKHIIDYIADNIETDYTYHGHKAGEIDLANNLEVYVLKGQFDEIKKLIK